MTRWMASIGVLALTAGGCYVSPEDAGNDQVASVDTLGVALSADSFCSSGELKVMIQPRDASGEVVASQSLAVSCSARGADGRAIGCSVRGVECSEGSLQSGKRSVTLMILDDSGSMSGNDPEKLRKQACIDFVNGSSTDDLIAVTDYGKAPSSGIDKGTQDLRVLTDFTSDKQLALAACEKVTDGGGTPLYESVQEGIDILLAEAQTKYPDASFALLLLSDGRPNSDSQRDSAIDAAKQRQIPIYTVGLGPAAEGSLADSFIPCEAESDCSVYDVGAECRSVTPDKKRCFLPSSDPDAIRVLQELASESGGTYAAATDPTALQSLFANVSSAVREGKCNVEAQLALGSTPAQIGERIEGTLSVGSAGAKADYHFTVPAPQLDSAKLCQ